MLVTKYSKTERRWHSYARLLDWHFKHKDHPKARLVGAKADELAERDDPRYRERN